MVSLMRSGFLPIRMDSTRDDVTSFTTYQYNAHGQKAQTDTWLNRFDHNTGKIINEGTSTSMVYAWETDAYGNSFKAANRYMDVAQTASFRLLPIAADPELEADDPTYYSIVGINGKCLDAHDAVNGTSIHIFDCEGNDNQKWSYNPGTREIKNLDGLCIDVKGGAAKDNADVQVADCNGKDGQKWTPYADGEVPGQMQGIGGKCLDVLHSGTDNNTNVQLYGCNDNGSGQKWAFLSAEVAQPIVSRSDGKCLTSDGEFHNGVNVVVKDCSDSSRKWAYDPEKHGRIVAEPAGKCLDIDHHHENNANVQMYDCHDGDDKQAWVYYANTGEIKSLDYCLDVQQGGTNVQIYGCAGGSNQRWEWTALPPRLVPFPVSIPDFALADSLVPHLLGSKAHIYAQVTIDGLDDPVYLPKRSYIYQTNADEGEMPAFDPSNPAPGWIPTGETTTYDGETGIPLVTTNVQTGMVSSRFLTHSEPRISYATFGNANAHTQEAGYIGFETYEDQTQNTNFTLSGGSISTHGYSGAKAYGAGSGTVSVAVNSYNVPAGRPALLSAWVKASDGETCQLGIGQKIDTSQSGDGKTWQYLEVTADAGASASISCNSGGYIDEVLIRPADSSFGSKAHDAQYRITETTGNSGIVTHLVRDPRNRLLGSYRQDPQGRVRLSGFPIAGFSRYNGYGFEISEPVRNDFTQDQPNHSATIAFQDDTQSWFIESLSAEQSHYLSASRRFAMRMLVYDTIDLTVGSSGTTPISLTESEQRLVLSQDDVSEESDNIPGSETARILTWVVIDQFSAVFLDGKMVISTDKLEPLSDPGPASIVFNEGIYGKIFVGQDPVFARSFHDGAGRAIQAQSLRLDGDDKPKRVKISQVLYDGWGKPAVQTKLTERNQALGDYDTGFVTGFDWDTDTIAGDISTAFDKGHPFTRTRYADSPLLRPSVQSLLPGDEFDIASTRAEKFSYDSIQDAADNGLLGRHDLYQVQNFLPYTDEIMMDSTVVTDKAGRTVSTKHGNENHGGYIEWKYQYDYWTGGAFRETTAFTPNYNAATVAGHDEFKNVSTSWNSRGTVATSQEPDLSGYALVVKDNLGRPRFARTNVGDLSGTVSGVSYISYDLGGRISETGVLKNVSKSVAEYRTLADDPTFPSASQTCWQKRYLYDTDLQTGNEQKFLAGRVYGLVGNMNLIFDKPTDSCFDGEDKGKSYIFYKYDQRGRTIAMSEVTNQTVRNSAYQYNNLGTRLAVTFPNTEKMTSGDQSTGFEDLSQKRKGELLFNSDGQKSVHYLRNPLGQLSAVCDTADCSGTKYASKYRYDVFGKILSNKLNKEDLTQTMNYDFQERLTDLRTEQDSTSVLGESLKYDPYRSGNIRETHYTGTGLGNDGEHAYKYEYDIWGRLTEAGRFEGDDFDTQSKKYEYSYDHNGNILSKKITGAADDDVVGNYAYAYQSGKNQLASVTDSVTGTARNFTHSDHGAITSFTNSAGNTNEYVLDSRNDRVYRVTSGGHTAAYSYDPLGRRIGKVVGIGPEPVVPSSHYTIVGLGGKCIDVAGSATEDGTNIQLWTCNGSDAQEWTLNETTGEIKGLGGKCIDVEHSGTEDGTNIQLWECNGTDAQKWTLDETTGEIKGLGGKCIDVAGSEDGTNIRLWTCNGTDAQKWEWVDIFSEITGAEKTGNIKGLGSKCIDVAGSEDGANIQLWGCSGTAAQNWTLDENTGEIKGLGSKCIDVEGAVTTEGTNIQLYECHGGDNQKWTLDENTGEIKGLGGKCIDVRHSETEDGTNIQLSQCNGTDAQKWQWIERPPRAIKGLGGKCIDVAGSGTEDGTNIQLWTCNGTDAQKWTFDENTGEIKGLGGKCIDVAGSEDGTNIQLWTCNGTDAQKWTYNKTTGEIKGLGGKCIDVAGSATEDGTNIRLWTCTGTNAQKWEWVDIFSEITGAGKTGNIKGLGGKCIDVEGSATEDGTNIQLWECNVTDAQKWTLDENTGEIKGLGGKCIDVEGSGTEDGTNIQLWTCTGNDNQKWTLDENTGEIKGLGDKCISIDPESTEDGTNIQLSQCNGTGAQKWEWVHISSEITGAGKTGAIKGLGGKCIDVEHSGTEDGTNIQLSHCNGTDAQKWTLDETTGAIKGLGGKCIDVQGSGTAEGTNIQLWTCTGTDAQKWTYNETTEEIKGLGGNCIDVRHSETEDGTNIQLSQCNGTDAQKWQWVGPPTGAIKGLGGKCIDVTHSGTEDGTNIQLSHCNGTDAQKWTLDPTSGEIKGLGGKCIDVAGSGTEDGTNIQLWDCNDGQDNQKWTYNETTEEIKGLGGKCIDVAPYSTEDGANIQLRTCNGTGSQKWEWVGPPTGEIKGLGGKCIDVAGSGTEDGTNIQLWTCNGTDAQKWTLDETTEEIKGLGGKCIDVAGSGTEDGTNIQLWDCNDGQDNQKWTYNETTEEIKGLGGKCIDVAPYSTEDGANIQLRTCNGTGSQKWQWVEAPPSASLAALTMNEHDGDLEGWEITHDEPVSVDRIGVHHGPLYNDQVSALTVADGHTVEVYKHANYEGQQLTFVGPRTVGVPDLDAHGMNDAISSYKLYPTPAVAVPGAPANLSATPGDGQVTLSWDDPGDTTIDKYQLLVRALGKLTASDAAAGDQFGISVAVDGDTAVVGSYRDDEAGDDSGSAYVFAKDSSGAWSQQAKLTPLDGDEGDQFGWSVALDGDTAAIGAPGDDHNGFIDGGSAYVFTRDPSGVWSEAAKLTASDAGDSHRFGEAVAVDGDTIVTGAVGGINGVGVIPGGVLSGAAYVFTKPGGGWANGNETAKLTPSDGVFLDVFGNSVAVDGDTIVIGTHFDPSGSASGRAYAFTKPNGGWSDATETAQLTASDGESGDNFGFAVAVDGDTMVIGSPLDDDHDTDSGSVYVFVENSSGWSQTAKLVASDGALGDEFGFAVAVEGDTVVIGSRLDDDSGTDSGSVYVFIEDSSGWSQRAKFTASEGAAGYNFGVAVAAGSDAIAAGAPGGTGIASESGSAYILDIGDDWTDIAGSGAATTSHTVTGLTGGVRYTLAVRAVNVSGESGASTMTAAPLWPAPANLAAAPDSGRIVLQWDTGATGISNYLVRTEVTGGGGDLSETLVPAGSGTKTTAEVTSLTNGTEYNFMVQAAEVSVGETVVTGAASSVTATPTAVLPSMPTGLTATAGDGQVTLTWDDPGNITIRKHQYSTDGGTTFMDISGSGAATTTYTVTGLTGVGEYTFAVRAVNDSGESEASTVTATAGWPAPTNLVATPGDGRVTLEWDTGDSGIASYVVRQEVTGSGNSFDMMISAGNGATTSYTITSLTNGTEYTFTVAAAEFESGTNAVILTGLTATVTAAPLWPAPANLAAAPDSGRIVLQWDTGAPEITNYLVRTEVTGGGGDLSETLVPAGSGTKTTAEVTSLTNGTEYAFIVQAAEVSVGETVVTGMGATATETPTVAVPAPPTGLTATPDDGQVAVTWDNPGNITIRKYQYSTDGGSSFNHMNGSNRDTTSFTFSNLTNGTEYTLAIRASNLSDESTAATVTATPLGPAPTNLVATPGDGRVTLEWDTGDSGIASYVVRQEVTGSGNSFSTMISAGNEATTSYTIASLTNGTEYTFTVAAAEFESGTNAVILTGLTATVTAAPLWPAPANLAAAPDSGRIVLQWDTGGPEITNYLVRTEVTGGGGDPSETLVPAGSGTKTTAEVTSLTNGTEYDFMVQAAEVSGGETVVTGAASSVTATPTAAVPEAPTGLTATPGDGQVTLTWDDPGNITIRKHQYSTDGGTTFMDISGSGAATTTYTVTGLTGVGEYTLAVRAVNDSGESEASTVTAAPLWSALTLSQHGSDEDGWELTHHDAVLVAWVGVEHGAEYNDEISALTVADGYTVEVYQHANYEGHQLTFEGPLTVGAEDLEPHGMNDAISSYKLYPTPVAVPGTPAGLTATAGVGQVTLTWDDPGDISITGYEYLLHMQAAKLTASDGAALDRFGRSVAVDGDTAVVGSPMDDNGKGAAYVFTRQPGGWSQVAKLTAFDGASDDRFGNSVAVNGDTVVVGAWLDDGGDSNSGSAYVFTEPGGGWTTTTETAKLTASGGGATDDRFGTSVAMDGDTVVVGAPGVHNGKGSAYVFTEPNDGWATATETAKLTSYDRDPGDRFGTSVAVDGDTVVVGAPGVHNGKGSAYVFTEPNDGWTTATETAKLTAFDGVSDDRFGKSVAVGGDTVIVGAWLDDSDKGSAYVFTKPSSGWATATETAKLTSYDRDPGDRFGISVAVDGDTVVAGASGVHSGKGSAYMFTEPSGGWTTATETAKLTAYDGDPGDRFGVSVAVDDDTVVTGAWRDDDNGSDSGSAYVHTVSDWTDIPGSAAGGTNETSYTLTNLTNGTEHTFRIRATNAVGAAPGSEAVTAVPTS